MGKLVHGTGGKEGEGGSGACDGTASPVEGRDCGVKPQVIRCARWRETDLLCQNPWPANLFCR